MVNSSALSEFFALFGSAGAADLDPSHPGKSSRLANAATSAGSHRWPACILRGFLMTAFSWQAPRSFRFLQLLQRGHIRGQRLPIGQLHRSVAALGIQIIQETGSASLVSILTDVARVLRLLEVARGIELHHFFVAPDGLIGIGYVGKNGITGRLLLLLCLRQCMAGACDLSLIAVEDRQLKISEQRSGILAGNVSEIIRTVYI